LRPDIPSNTTFNLLTADGGTNPQSPNEAGVEANLDIQYTMGTFFLNPWFGNLFFVRYCDWSSYAVPFGWWIGQHCRIRHIFVGHDYFT
jgi:hypothetical protein